MKFLKTTLVVLLLAMLCLGSLVACSENATETPTTDPTAAPTEAPTQTPTVAPEVPTQPPMEDSDNKPQDYIITIAKALEICMANDEPTVERYLIQGVIDTVTNAEYGGMKISDETGSISVYGTYSADGSLKYSEMDEKPYKGDTVLLDCTLQNYNGNPEVHNARLISFERGEINVDEKDYTEMTISQARDASEGTKVKVDGVVARITYANGMKPMGVFLVDETQSIYVYNADFAQRVQIGNTVTILGTKAYWILDTEENNAEKFGYGGCCQIEDVTVVSIDDSKVEFDKSWIKESTVKDMLDTPLSENITSTIYKVNALVKKVDGAGFVNYNFYDLDGKTNSYTYTQCNGGDFSWLDEFDGKICTVYLSIINAKSTSTGCVYRFSPILVIDEGFKFDTANAAEHVVKYYGLSQFLEKYMGNPEAELISSVSSELLGFEGATLTYTSNNEEVAYFTEVDGKVIFNCGKAGSAQITITGEYNGITYSETVVVTVEEAIEYDTVTVKGAIESSVGDELIIKGIVGPSLVNQKGFYLIDETGIIAVRVDDADILKTISIGNEIIISGKRSNAKGAQICVDGGVVLVNNFGDHEYNTDNFITDKSITDMVGVSGIEHTAEAYIVKATVTKKGSQFSTTYSLSDGTSSLLLYSGGASQYSFLDEFVDQEVTLEVAICDWNSKGNKGCVLAVYTEDGKVINSLNFQ